MTPSEEESSSEESFKDRSEAESSVVLSSSSALDALSNCWCINGMEAIYLEGMQSKERGKPTRSIYEEPRVILDGLSYVLNL